MNNMNGVREMKEGFVLRYDQARFIGIIVSEDGEYERFFFHRDRIVKGPIDAKPNDRVLFLVGDKPPLPRKLRIAHSIVILEDNTAGMDALSGQNGDGGAK